ncbi:MAG: DUF2442 domain-containing protein [Planctomycetes bacterium]|nr:DUF2442 domain-containing protein [Planctomycetota bacterium]
MKSKAHGTNTLDVEISNIGSLGIWICVQDTEYFMDYKDFPWFKEARVKEILDAQLLHGHHLHWPQLDIDLEIDSLENPSRYPLISSQVREQQP